MLLDFKNWWKYQVLIISFIMKKALWFLSKDETVSEHSVLPQMSTKAEPSRTGLAHEAV